MKRKVKDLITGLDVGETKIVCAIGRLNESSGAVDIRGVGAADSRGLKNGVVIDIESLSEVIAEAVEDAEDQAECRINSLYTNLSGKDILAIRSPGSVVVSDSRTQVRDRDVERALKQAENIALPLDRDILHRFIDNFTVDNQADVVNPVGLYGSRLLVDVYFITALRKHIKNLVRTINQAGFEVIDLVLSNLANAQACLNENELSLTSVLVDIGVSSTSVSLVNNHKIRWHDVITLGGDYLTESISDFFKISRESAEDIKLRYARTGDAHSPESEEKIFLNQGRDDISITRSELTHLVDLRLHQLFNSIIGRMERGGFKLSQQSAMALTGRTAQLDGLLESAEVFFGIPVHLGYPKGLAKSVGSLSDPRYTTAVGLVKYAAGEKMKLKKTSSQHQAISSLISKARQFFQEYF